MHFIWVSKKAQLPPNVCFPFFFFIAGMLSNKTLITWTELCEKQIATLKLDGKLGEPTIPHLCFPLDGCCRASRSDPLKKEGDGSHTSLSLRLLQRLLQLEGVRTQMQKLLSHKPYILDLKRRLTTGITAPNSIKTNKKQVHNSPADQRGLQRADRTTA